MKNVLFISYAYAPINVTGVTRPLKFSSYLNEFNWKPFVLCVKNPDQRLYPSSGIPVPKNVSVNPVSTIPYSEVFGAVLNKVFKETQFLLPDNCIGWKLKAKSEGLRIIKKNKIKMIFTTSPPYTSAVIGSYLKEKTGLPLVVDLRDGWSLQPWRKYPTEFHKNRDKKIEESVLRNADHCIVVSEAMRSDYVKAYPFLRKKISIIYNGFDTKDFNEKKKMDLYDKFTISYVGTFYSPSYKFYKNPENFLKALAFLKSKERIPQDFRFQMVGKKYDHINELVKKYGLEEITRTTGIIPYQEAIKCMKKSHMLLLIEYSTPLTLKVYEYLATRRAILAMIAKNELREIVRNNCENPYIVNYKKSEKIAEAISNCFDLYSNNKLKTDEEKYQKYTAKFSRKQLTNQLAGIFNELS